MFKSIDLTIKWIQLGLLIHNNYDWLTKREEGCLEFKRQLNELGIMGVKLGQFLYSNKLIISPVLLYLFEDFLSYNKTHTIKETHEMLQKSNNYDEFIKKYNIEIEDSVLASGSLAQTHICYLNGNKEKKYVLKIANPEIIYLETELNILKTLVKTVSYFKSINIDWDSFFKNIATQIDFNVEAENIKIFYKIYKKYDKIEIPEMVYSGNYFIIMSYCEGIQMNLIDQKSELYIKATNLLTASFLHSSYKHFITHGDMHKGNVLVKPNGNIALLDFGICSHFIQDKNDRSEINDILYTYLDFYYNTNLLNVVKIMKSLFIYNKATKIDLEAIFKNILQEYVINDSKDKDKYMFSNLIQFSYKNNFKIKESLINLLSQLLILDSFVIKEKYNGSLLFRTLSYMKSEPFFMNEMGEYIKMFYKLEYNNEKIEEIKKLYP